MLNVISDRTEDGVCIKWFMKIDAKWAEGKERGLFTNLSLLRKINR